MMNRALCFRFMVLFLALAFALCILESSAHQFAEKCHQIAQQKLKVNISEGCHNGSFVDHNIVYCCNGRNVANLLANISADVIYVYKADLDDKDLGELTLHPQVKYLYIERCSNITFIPQFKSNDYLLELSLKQCGITDIRSGAFDGLSSLKSLSLESNEIGEIMSGHFSKIPSLEKLNLIHNDMKHIPSDLFNRRNNIIELEFSLNREIRNIDKDTFTSLTKLRHLKLENCYINQIQPGAFDKLSNLTILNLAGNQLTDFPVFNVRNNKMRKLYVHNNKIKELRSDHLTNIPHLSDIGLQNNNFKVVPNNFFKERNTISSLSFANTPIRRIEDRAFANLTYLTWMSLDGTDIESFPTRDLKLLRYISLKNVKRLFSMPDDITGIERVEVSPDRSFLCCKFILDIYHDNTRPRTLLYIEPTKEPTNFASTTMHSDGGGGSTNTSTTIPPGFGRRRRGDHSGHVRVITAGTFNSSIPFYTGKSSKVNCSPIPDEFQPCEDIMGAEWLTVVSFFVAPFALCGNLIVIVVLLCVGREYNVPRFLVTNLAVADICLGIYLMSLVIESVMTSGRYYNHVKEFQYGVACQSLGFLAMFSNILSVFSLTMITVERYLTIVYALYPKRRLRMKHALILMACGWCVAITVGVLPILGVSEYNKVAICLPFEVENGGNYYLLFVFAFNAVSFVFIAILYAQIYRSVFAPDASSSPPSTGHDIRVARRMAVLVLTDFACFAPIAVAGLSAMFGNSLITVAQSKYLLVFFFPLNSFMNPFLYALVTKTFRRDLANLLKNCFVCGQTMRTYMTSSLPGRSVHAHNNDFLSRTRQSFDFNTTDCNGSNGNLRCQSVNSLATSVSKNDPSLVRFQSMPMDGVSSTIPQP